MPPLSRSQIDQLGRRLRGSDPTIEDLKLLERMRSLYEEPLTEVIAVLVGLGLEPGSRSKTTGTIVDKLRRIPELRLSEMQDLAGTRVVVGMTRGEQDVLVEQITARFDNPRIVDRRARPSHGYRAVHIIVRVQGRPVEIQIRTRLQDLWAQIMERLADDWGRGIRYGEPLSEPSRRVGAITRQQVVESLMDLANAVDMVEHIAQLRKEHDRIIEIGKPEQPSAPAEDVAAVYTQFEERERRVRAILEALHDAIASRTLGS
jgi:ppGpp synthetase/RelA/SpoT-type nucleotidyltranferase